MVCLVVAAHGHLAEGLVASSAMIVGPSDDVVAVTFEPSEGPDDLLAKYAAAVEASSSQVSVRGYDQADHGRGPFPSGLPPQVRMAWATATCVTWRR